MLKKISVFLLLALGVFSFVLGYSVIEVGAEGSQGLLEQMKGSGGSGVNDITGKISETGGSLYDAAKEIAIVGGILSIVGAGFIFALMGGNANALGGAKSRLLWVFVGLFLVFGAIMIVATFLQWLGWGVK